jgi:hypothetical protein
MDGYQKLDYNNAKNTGKYNPERDELTFEHIVPADGMQGLISNPENKNSVFMVASQFNALEMHTPKVTAAKGVTIYADDPSQGTACAMTCPAALIYRNYLLDPRPLDPAIKQSGQYPLELNLLERVEKLIQNDKNQWWTMTNGYLLPKSRKNYELMETMLEEMDSLNDARDQVEVAVHWETAVADCEHRVTQVVCSAVDVSKFKAEITPKVWTAHNNLAMCVLHAGFYATLAVAALRAQKLGEEVSVYLTPLGAGAPGNRVLLIANALKSALREFRMAPLRVYLVHDTSTPAELLALPTGTCAKRKARAVLELSEDAKKTFILKRGFSTRERKCALCLKLGTGYVKVNRNRPQVFACTTCLRVDEAWLADVMKEDATEEDVDAASPILL